MKYLAWLVLAPALFLSSCSPPPPPAAAPPEAQASYGADALDLAGVKTATAADKPIQARLQLPGQVNLTENGQAQITAPLNGVVVDVLVKAGQHVASGTPLAVINSVYGQTALQILKNLEGDQTGVVQAQANLTAAEGNLGTAQSTLSQARSSLAVARIALNQAVDTLDQAEAERVRARIDLTRKKDLFTAGVFAKGDVEDAQERWDKAVSAWRDANKSSSDAHRSVKLADENVSIDAGNVHNFQANVGDARHSVLLAQANLERDKAVFRQGQLSGSEVSQNLTPVSLQGGQYSATAAADATTFFIRAPLTGTVTSVVMTRGLSVDPGTALATVVNTQQVYVDANAFEADLASVHVDDPVEITVPAYPAATFKGVVHMVGKTVDPTTRTVPVRATIQNDDGRLKAGMFVTVTVLLRKPHVALVVPDGAILVHGDNRYVFVETSGSHIEKREVKTGISAQGETEVVSGLKDGDVVVTEGNLLLEGQE